MKPNAIAKLSVDALMLILLLALMGYHLWGEAAHEWAWARECSRCSSCTTG